MASPITVELEPIGKVPHGLASSVALSDNDYVTEGGEAKIYAKHGVVYKLYHHPEKTIPRGKVEELTVLDHKSIVCPWGMLITGGKVCGIFMAQVPQAQPVARLFTNTFRQRHSVTDEITLEVINQIQQSIEHVHQHQCLVVDANEFNYLVSQHFEMVYAIDVSAYQPPHFPATAIMPTIQDPKAKSFSPLSDWYAFAIVACQLLIGIHPYKGHHPKYPTAKVLERMAAGASIFDPGVNLPDQVRDLSLIPDSYRQWFVELFCDGKRSTPPASATAVSFSTILIPKAIIGVYQDAIIPLPTGVTVMASIHAERIALNHQPTTLTASQIFAWGPSLYVLYKERFIEVKLNIFSGKIIPSITKVWNVLPHATTMFDGFVYQNILGFPYLLVPTQPGNCAVIKVPELQGYKIMDGSRTQTLMEIIAAKNGVYDRFHLTVDAKTGKYKIRTQHDVDYR